MATSLISPLMMVTWARTVPSIPSRIAFVGMDGGTWLGQTTPMSCLPVNVLGAGGAGGGGGAMTAGSFGGADTAAMVGACVGGDTSGGGTKGGGGA